MGYYIDFDETKAELTKDPFIGSRVTSKGDSYLENMIDYAEKYIDNMDYIGLPQNDVGHCFPRDYTDIIEDDSISEADIKLLKRCNNQIPYEIRRAALFLVRDLYTISNIKVLSDLDKALGLRSFSAGALSVGFSGKGDFVSKEVKRLLAIFQSVNFRIRNQ